MKRSTFLKTLLIAPFAGVASLSVLANVKPALGTSPLDRCGIRRILLECCRQANYYAKEVEYKFGNPLAREDFNEYFIRYLENLKQRGAFDGYVCYAETFLGQSFNQHNVTLWIRSKSWSGVEIRLSPMTSSWKPLDKSKTPSWL